MVSYSVLQKLAHIARETIANGITKLEACGLLTRIKRRICVTWHQGGKQSKQAENAYLFHPQTDHSEFTACTVFQGQEVLHFIEAPPAAVVASREALAKHRQRFEERFREDWLRKRSGGSAQPSSPTSLTPMLPFGRAV